MIPALHELLQQSSAMLFYLGAAFTPEAGLYLDVQEPAITAIMANRQWDVLVVDEQRPSLRARLRRAAEELGDWQLHIAGVRVDGKTLLELAMTPEQEPIIRAAREKLRCPVDLEDLLLFIDDVLAEPTIRGKRIWLTPGRARNSGIFLHPDDVFRRRRPRRYADGWNEIHIDEPQAKKNLEPAQDGEILGPRWWARFQNPDGEAAMLEALATSAPSQTFHTRIASLMGQLRDQGTYVYLASTLRHRERGYLMWGSLILSQTTTEEAVQKTVAMLERLNGEWGLNIAIVWMHPDGWAATIEGARQMVDAYDVVYATRHAAQNSDHYDGVAADFVAVGLPRELTLTGPDGDKRTFDLSAPRQARDLNLTPKLIDWVEKHFEFEKLRSDYPHWSDRAKPVSPADS
ncbi:MAG: hypothetical protein A2341_03945 [Deltaproteobacteria bacterium RIFOXYB12_FULL_58_9]|nr:MAG: hypothetical protein A2341_03945 [Deltaproteobacteria bacterium RIFOXYB12_FULL_58_9]